MYEVKTSSEHAGGAEMSEVSCLLPRDDGYLGLGKATFRQFCSTLSFQRLRYDHCQRRRIILSLTDRTNSFV